MKNWKYWIPFIGTFIVMAEKIWNGDAAEKALVSMWGFVIIALIVFFLAAMTGVIQK